MNYDGLPMGLREGVHLYIEHGVIPGEFLQAVISNDLKESFGKADIYNRERMFDIVSWFYNNAPAECWGSKEKMIAWSEMMRK